MRKTAINLALIAAVLLAPCVEAQEKVRKQEKVLQAGTGLVDRGRLADDAVGNTVPDNLGGSKVERELNLPG